MTTTAGVEPTLPLTEIRKHPANPRINAVADEAMVESIRLHGLFDPVLLAPDHTLIDGHRRLDGAERAGLVEIPVRIRHDLVTEAQQIIAMITTGLQKENLTPVEEAAAYEQLALQGLDDAAIAAEVGFGVRRVRDRMKLNTLSTETRAKLHAGDATLVDIAALDEFADNAGDRAELEEVLGTDNFQHTLHSIRGRRARDARRAELVDQFVAAGAVLAEKVPGGAGLVVVDGVEHRASGMHMFSGDLQDPAAHDGCLAYVLPEYVYDDPRLICIDRPRHPGTEAARPVAPVTSDWEKQQEERAELAARRAAAQATRLAWMVEHLTGLVPAKSHGPLAAAVQGFLPALLVDTRDVPDDEILLAGLGASPESREYAALESARAAYADELSGQNVTRTLASFAGYLAAIVVGRLSDGDDPQFIDDIVEAQHLLGLWDWMKTAGYPLSDQDKADRTALEVRHTELAARVEAEAS